MAHDDDFWWNDAIQNRAPSNLWGTYNDDGEPKGCLHTTETDSFTPRATTYFGGTSYPHFTFYPRVATRTVQTYQHIPVNRAARALKNLSGGVATNNDRVVQTEIVWRAANAGNLPNWALDGLARLMRWCEHTMAIPRRAVAFYAYPPPNNHRLGSEPWRMSGAAFDAYSGWLGHQHVPENVHGDPGAINMNYLMAGAFDPAPFPTEQESLLMAAAHSDDDARRALIRQWFWAYLGRGFKDAGEQNWHLENFKGKGADIALAIISDSTEAQAFRTKRGW